jgi:hypothetical protein
MPTGKKEPEDIFAGLDTGNEAPAAAPNATSAPRKSPIKMILMILAGFVVLGGIGFAAWYFLIRQEAPSAVVPAPTAVTPSVVPSQPEPVVEVPPVVPVTEPPAGSDIPLPTDTVDTTTPAVQTPVVTATPGLDRDSDGLTDAEEALFGTNPLSPDTDGDTYQDGAEVLGGYDPTAAKAALVTSSRFKSVTVRSVATARIPSAWTEEGAAGTQYINTGTAENFQITERRLADEPTDLTLTDWFASDAGVAPVTLRVFRTRGGYDAWQTEDGRTTYVVVGQTVLVVKYASDGSTSVEFRATYDVFVNTLNVI